MRKPFYILLAAALVLLLMACARIGTPDGGPYDETPPRVLSTTPRAGATKSHHHKVVLRFDENIKLDNASQKVVVSPPQINAPEITASGKQITVELLDSLQPDMTYTIDFADAIEDNNEGNPMGDYAFTFSTGEQLDTFQLGGYVLNAADLEPIKGILVGLYATDSVGPGVPDSAFRTKALERISRTDSRGHFIVKGLNPQKRYRVFALQDQDQDYRFSQKSEAVAYNHQLYTLRSAPDVRYDTVWHDSIYYDSIVPVPYTHYYPDDIVLRAFTEEGQARAFLKSERQQLEKFTLYFTAPDTVAPTLRGLNFSDSAAYVLERSAGNDTLTYWLRDSLVYLRDTLDILLTYRATDTLGQLVPQTDTLSLISRETYKRRQKQQQEKWEEYAKDYREQYRQDLRAKAYSADKQEQQDSQEQPGQPDNDPLGQNPPATDEPAATDEQEPADDDGKGKASKKKKKRKKTTKIKDEDIDVPPMPEEFLEMHMSPTSLDPDQNVTLRFNTPIDTALVELIHFSEAVNDSERVERPFLLERVEGQIMQYRLYAEWQPGTKYEVTLDTGAFVDIYGQRTADAKQGLTVKSLDDYSTLFVTLQHADTSAVVQLLNSSGKTVKSVRAPGGKADFYFIKPGTYYLSMYYDRNADGRWTTGNYDTDLQPEEVYFYPGAFELRASWEITQNWNPLLRPLYQQKPEHITKQKPEKAKDIHSKNAQRDEQKRRGGKSGNSTNNRGTSYGGGYVSQ